MVINLNFAPYPKSLLRNTILIQDKTDLNIEILTNRIFSKNFMELKFYEFIRSPVVKIEIKDFDYNHFFFTKFPSIQLTYNKIYDFPNQKLTQEEQEELQNQIGVSFDVNKPENYYCLAVLVENEDDDWEWRCVSRKIIDYNDKIIEFGIPYPGVFAVIYFPITVEEEASGDLDCDF